MVPAKETAEEQLLRMIEGPASPQPPKRMPKGWSLGGAVDRVRGTFESARHRLSMSATRIDRTDLFLWRLQLIDRVFWVVLAVLACYMIVDLAILKPSPPVILYPVPTAPSVTGLVGEPTFSSLKSMEEYQHALVGRNPFQLSIAAAEKAQVAERVDEQEDTLQKLISTLSVVGMNRGRVPEALIEDSSTNRTHIVTAGDRIGELRIVSIDDQGVTVSYDGKEALLP